MRMAMPTRRLDIDAPRDRSADNLWMAVLSPGGRGLGALLLVFGLLCSLVGSVGWWLNHEILSPSGWRSTSPALLADGDVRGAVGRFAVDELFGKTDVEKTLDSLLPTPTAGRLLSQLRARGLDLAGEILTSPRARAVWETANAQAHHELLSILDHGRSGNVALDLTPLLRELTRELLDSVPASLVPTAERHQLFGLSGSHPGNLPIFGARQVRQARPAVQTLRGLTLALGTAAVALFCAAILAAREWRARALVGVGACLIAAGALLFLTRELLVPVLAHGLVHNNTFRSGVQAAWLISTTELRTTGMWLSILGVAAVLLGATASRFSRSTYSAHKGGVA
jgi:hypothetical protein